MMPLVMGLVVFIAVHLIPTQVDLRQGLVARFGENAYKAAFAALSAIGMVLIVLGYHKLQVMPGKNPQIWVPPMAMRHVALTLMLPAMILLVAAYIPSRIRTLAKHPMLAAIKLWALAHLLSNGDLAGMIMFTAFLGWAIYARISMRSRHAPGPLGDAKGGLGGDIAAVVIGLSLYALLVLGGHYWLIGKAPILTRFTFAP